MKKFIIKFLRFTFRFLIQYLPIKLQIIISKNGFPNICLRDERIRYIGKVFGSKLKIYASTFSTIDRVATSRFVDKTEIVLGLKKINFSNFVCIDVGANIGAISLFMINLNAKKVLSFEPGPSYQKLVKNIDLNNLKNKIIPIKLGINEKKQTFIWKEIDNHLNGYLKPIEIKKLRIHNDNIVSTVNLDQYLEKIGEKKIDFIKFDIEGMEWKAIIGSKKTIQTYKPIMVVELQEGISKLTGKDSINPIFKYLYLQNYKSYFFYKNNFVKFKFPSVKLNSNYEVHYKKKIPNFIGDVFFIPEEKKYLINN
jgi:FkbM family methyltransferase